jgi:hypothetical protein
VRLTWPRVDQRGWEEFVAFIRNRAGGDGAGVIALGDEANYLSGLIVYESEHDLEEGRVLTLHLFTAVDLVNSLAPIHSLYRTATAKADELGCGGLQVRLHADQAAIAVHLRALGLSERAGYLWKKLATAPA